MAENHPKGQLTPLQDLTGRTFGSWAVLAYVGVKNRNNIYACRCVCGTQRDVYGFALTSERSRSCGKGRCSHRFSHGGSRGGTPEYVVWGAIKTRCCYGTNARVRKNYRDRGIVICARWRDSFAAFLEDMGPRPDELLSVDRVDNDGGYTCGRCDECRAHGWPANCRWATRGEQALNTRSNHWITFNGRRLSITQWSRETGLELATILYRLRSGWTVEKTLTTQTKYTRRKPAST